MPPVLQFPLLKSGNISINVSKTVLKPASFIIAIPLALVVHLHTKLQLRSMKFRNPRNRRRKVMLLRRLWMIVGTRWNNMLQFLSDRQLVLLCITTHTIVRISRSNNIFNVVFLIKATLWIDTVFLCMTARRKSVWWGLSILLNQCPIPRKKLHEKLQNQLDQWWKLLKRRNRCWNRRNLVQRIHLGGSMATQALQVVWWMIKILLILSRSHWVLLLKTVLWLVWLRLLPLHQIADPPVSPVRKVPLLVSVMLWFQYHPLDCYLAVVLGHTNRSWVRMIAVTLGNMQSFMQNSLLVRAG